MLPRQVHLSALKMPKGDESPAGSMAQGDVSSGLGFRISCWGLDLGLRVRGFGVEGCKTIMRIRLSQVFDPDIFDIDFFGLTASARARSSLRLKPYNPTCVRVHIQIYLRT